ncbi:SDR family oxidoreductase [Winogradskya humida]|uniref:NAD-dependent epimerase/dehydratase n=1 Tax=Winogradskya humida TaxID=113566 RepID=A0ABQ3ZG88_9ACTN|nr:SDR family oxidoreductase [Actinoplanes humidus]GIE17582.1 putative NAD-dependent epimerase/dehydratase [Actinoplanes humidus]
MRVFVTGASGYIGSAVVSELLGAGHEVTGLARSDRSAAALTAAGVQVHRGDLEDLDALRAGATDADAVIHTAFKHDDMANFGGAVALDLHAVQALAGAARRLVITSGTTMMRLGTAVTEDDLPGPEWPRGAAETAALESGVASIVRCPPSVHGEGDLHGFVTLIIAAAREKGFSAYVGDGANRWPAVDRLDAARLFRLAVEADSVGHRLHAVGDEGVPFREIAESVGRHLGVPVKSIAPEQAADHFGFLGMLAGADTPATNALTRKLLTWEPTQPGLLADLDSGHYFA